MAAFYFTKLPLHSEENSSHPDIFCRACGLNSIPRPELATALTRFTCRTCCDFLLEFRDRETADTLSAIGAQIDRACLRETAFVGHVNVNSE
jgi:hypothetical protein